MSKFKVGDKVRCVDVGYNIHITEGEIYTVSSCSAESTMLSITSNRGELDKYQDHRFELVEAVKPDYPNPPHVHAELIKAWADGAEIEIKTVYGRWRINRKPEWLPECEYRIKPAGTPTQKKAREIREQMEGLAEELKELEGMEI